MTLIHKISQSIVKQWIEISDSGLLNSKPDGFFIYCYYLLFYYYAHLIIIFMIFTCDFQLFYNYFKFLRIYLRIFIWKMKVIVCVRVVWILQVTLQSIINFTLESVLVGCTDLRRGSAEKEPLQMMGWLLVCKHASTTWTFHCTLFAWELCLV